MMKFFEDAAALCYGSLMLSTNMNKAGETDSFSALRTAAVKAGDRSVRSSFRPAVRHA